MSEIKNNIYFAIRKMQTTAYQSYVNDMKPFSSIPKKQLIYNEGFRHGIDRAISILLESLNCEDEQ